MKEIFRQTYRDRPCCFSELSTKQVTLLVDSQTQIGFREEIRGICKLQIVVFVTFKWLPISLIMLYSLDNVHCKQSDLAIVDTNRYRLVESKL